MARHNVMQDSEYWRSGSPQATYIYFKVETDNFSNQPHRVFSSGFTVGGAAIKDNQTLKACTQNSTVSASNLAAAQIQQSNHNNSNSSKESYFWGKAICQGKTAMVGSILGPPKLMHQHRNGLDTQGSHTWGSLRTERQTFTRVSPWFFFLPFPCICCLLHQINCFTSRAEFLWIAQLFHHYMEIGKHNLFLFWLFVCRHSLSGY